MQRRKRGLIATLPFVTLLAGACTFEAQMTHEPAVATSEDQITFTAEARSNGNIKDLSMDMYVGGVLVQTCTTTPCTYTGGPYPGFENEWLGYHVEASGEVPGVPGPTTKSDTDLGYTGITEPDYSWKASQGAWFVPVRWGDWSWQNANILLSRAPDYVTNFGSGFGVFMDDINDKMNDVFWPKEKLFAHHDDVNVYAYRKTAASASSCGQPHADAATDAPWATDHGILHVANFGDCTSGFERFSAEGTTNTQAFLHELSHSVYELADEYDGFTFYFEAANEPNIFDTEAGCRAEQTAKSRNPDECYQFTANQSGWWGTHTGTTVMTNGLVTHPWSLESEERLDWWFDNN